MTQDMHDMMTQQGEIILYQPDETVRLEVRLEDDTVWLIQAQIQQVRNPNHIPQYMSNPKRMLQDMGKGKASTSLLSLSCFSTPEKAESFYTNLRKAFKNAANSIGDSLTEGHLKNEDGRKTSTADNGHFDFYEYETCDLNKSFQITKNLIKEKNDEKD